MDRLLIATLNILNLADRWDERLPLLLADMAALQPDLHRAPGGGLPAPAGPAAGGLGRGSLRGDPGLGGAPGVRQQPPGQGAAGGHRRRAPGSRAVPGRPPRPDRAARRRDGSCSRSPTSTTCPTHRARAWPRWTRSCRGSRRRPPHDALIVVGDFNADPREPAYGRMCEAGFRSAFEEANGAGARRDLAERAAGRGHGHRRRPGLPRLRLAARRGGGRRGAAGLRPARGRRPDPVRSDHLGIAARVRVG